MEDDVPYANCATTAVVGTSEKRIGRDGLCESCRRYRAIAPMTDEGLGGVMRSLEMFLGDGLRLKRENVG